MGDMDTTTIILLASPVIVLQLVLMVINLLNWNRKKKTRYLDKVWWLAIIILGGLIGNVVYMILESDKNDSDKN